MANKRNIEPAKFPFGHNLAKELSSGRLREIGEWALMWFGIDKRSRGDYDTRLAEWHKLLTIHRDKSVNWPFENASNIGLPLLATACIQFSMRASAALLPARNIVKPHHIHEDNPREQKAADRVAKYMNYQLSEQVGFFHDSMETTVMQQPLNGIAFRKTWFDDIKRVVRSDYVSPKDLIINYHTKRLEEARRITHILRYFPEELVLRKKKGIFLEDAVDKALGIHKENKSEQQIYETELGVEQAHNTQLDSEVDSNLGIESPAEEQPLDTLEIHCVYDINGDGIAEPLVITMDYSSGMVYRIVSRMHPDYSEPFMAFTDYPMIPNPESYLAMGFGMMFEGVNKGCDSILNQLIDSGTLANLQTGFYKRESGLKRGKLRPSMGEFTPVDLAPGEKIDDSLMQFKFSEPSNVLFQMLSLLSSYYDRLSTVTELTTGGMPRSDTPAGTMSTAVEQGQMIFRRIFQRNHRSFRKELRNLYMLNGIYFDEIESDYRRIIDENNVLEEVFQDFQQIDIIVPVSNPAAMDEQERLKKAQTVYEITANDPLTAQNMRVRKNALKDYLEVISGDNAEELVPTEEEMEQMMQPEGGERQKQLPSIPGQEEGTPGQASEGGVKQQ